MSISTITSITPLFNNYSNVHRYRHLPLYVEDDTNEQVDSTVLITQNFDEASPLIFTDTARWAQPLVMSIPEDGQDGKLSAYLDNQFDNIFNDAGAESIFGIISGNIEWLATPPTDYVLQIDISVNIDEMSHLATSVKIPAASAAEHYYVYLQDTSGDLPTFTSAAANTTTVNAKFVNSTTGQVISNTSYKIEKTNDNWSFTNINIGNDSNITRQLGILHASDFAISSDIRTMIFNGLSAIPTSFQLTAATSAVLHTTKPISSWANDAGWPISSTTVGSTRYTITGWTITDNGVPDAHNPYTPPQYYQIADNAGVISCVPRITSANNQGPRTITANTKWSWAEKNTTRNNKSGRFGGGYFNLPNAVPGTMAQVNVTGYVDSRNVRKTQTGLNDVVIVSHYKNSATDKKSISVKVDSSGRIYLYGTWFLAAGNKNYLHPGYANWHNGSGYVHITSIKYTANQ